MEETPQEFVYLLSKLSERRNSVNRITLAFHIFVNICGESWMLILRPFVRNSSGSLGDFRNCTYDCVGVIYKAYDLSRTRICKGLSAIKADEPHVRMLEFIFSRNVSCEALWRKGL